MQAGNSIPLGVVLRIAENIAKALNAEPHRFIVEETDDNQFTASYLDTNMFQYQLLGTFDTTEEAEAFTDNLPISISDAELFEYHKTAMKEYFALNPD